MNYNFELTEYCKGCKLSKFYTTASANGLDEIIKKLHCSHEDACKRIYENCQQRHADEMRDLQNKITLDERVRFNTSHVKLKDDGTYIVVKSSDVDKFLISGEAKEFMRLLNRIQDAKGKVNRYLVCNKDEPYAHDVLDAILQGECAKKKAKEDGLLNED